MSKHQSRGQRRVSRAKHTAAQLATRRTLIAAHVATEREHVRTAGRCAGPGAQAYLAGSIHYTTFGADNDYVTTLDVAGWIGGWRNALRAMRRERAAWRKFQRARAFEKALRFGLLYGNHPFDARLLCGVRSHPHDVGFDTMLQARAAEAGAPHDLKFVAARYMAEAPFNDLELRVLALKGGKP